MFTWLNKQGVKSDKGFEVQSINRFKIEYREHNRSISIHVERGVSGGKPCVIIKEDAFEKWDDGIRITADKQIEISRNFSEAMNFQGIVVI
ncbi:MAG: hypothetical protein WC539_01315 [Nitrospirota bacterium]